MNNGANAPAAFHSAVVLGASGHVGRLLVRQLGGAGIVVTGVDLQAQAESDANAALWLQSDAAALTSAAHQALAAADVVFICLPEAVTLAALPKVLQAAGGQALIADTLSVKSRVAEALQSLGPDQEYLSLNPMFSPRLGFQGQNVAVVKLKVASRATAIISLLEAWGARVTTVTAEEHDRMTAIIQVATHAALLSLGLMLNEWRYDVKQAIGLATPPHRLCLAMLARMSDAAPEVYWDIQRANPHGPEVRQALAHALDQLSAVIHDENPRAFEQIIGGIAHVVQPLRSELLRVADSVSAASSL